MEIEELNKEGCAYGQITRDRLDRAVKDVNAMGKKVDDVDKKTDGIMVTVYKKINGIYLLMITNLAVIITALIVYIVTKKGG